VNATFQWINDTIRDEIDFVIWTGDSARHDNDEQIPRSEKQVISQNELVVQKFREVFGTSNDVGAASAFTIPIIPTLGNNDILPHNIFREGPNRWTRRYLETWRSFIPEEQRHQFARGGWFFVEAIPNRLAIFSLNTL
jgi:endopolyphosphatase